MKTKVWIVIWGLKDGGAETLAKDYARLVDKQKFDATIVTMYPFEDTANYRRAMDAGIRVLSVFKKRNILTRAVRILMGKQYIPMVLKALIKKEKPDSIHFNSHMASYFNPIRKGLSGIKLLYTCHSEASKHFVEKEEAAVRQLIREPGLRLIALHEDMKKELNLRFGKDDTVVIRNGVDLSRFRQTHTDRSVIRRNIGISKDAYVVGHVGRFSKEKNHAFLLKVFRELADRNPAAHLLLIGSGPLREQITEGIRQLHLQDRVTVLSHRTDMPDLLRVMDVMVFPSYYEGLSVALVEAQASGLRCVISDSINPANLLSENTIAVSLDADVKEWADVALNTDIKNAEYGNLDAYDINREIHRLERLYQGEVDV